MTPDKLREMVAHRCDRESRKPIAWSQRSLHYAVLLRCSCGREVIDSGPEPVRVLCHTNNAMYALEQRLRREVSA